MKRTSDGRWAHILCALLLPGVTFKDPINKDPINVLTIKTEMLKQQCGCCGQRDGACLSCHHCSALFHPSCGLVTGATFVIPLYDFYELQVRVYSIVDETWCDQRRYIYIFFFLPNIQSFSGFLPQAQQRERENTSC